MADDQAQHGVKEAANDEQLSNSEEEVVQEPPPSVEDASGGRG